MSLYEFSLLDLVELDATITCLPTGKPNMFLVSLQSSQLLSLLLLKAHKFLNTGWLLWIVHHGLYVVYVAYIFLVALIHQDVIFYLPL